MNASLLILGISTDYRTIRNEIADNFEPIETTTILLAAATTSLQLINTYE